MSVLTRFLKYTTFDTTSDPKSSSAPSAARELILGKFLEEELKSIGLTDVSFTDTGIVMGTLPATPGMESVPVLGLIAHMDTSPEAAGGPVNSRIVTFDGTAVELGHGKTLDPKVFPSLMNYVGQDIIVTDGATLLGCDDKAGIAAITEAVSELVNDTSVPHGKVRVAFTPDEEIGRGTENFDIEAFGADYAYTIDGGEIGAMDVNTFNAAQATVTFTGVSVHPGTAKNKMINAIKLAMDFIAKLPQSESPETTEGYEGYYHPIEIGGGVASAKVTLIIRDHDTDEFERRKAFVAGLAASFGSAASIEMHDQYYNMARFLEDVPEVVQLPKTAMANLGIKTVIRVERGGTDGAMLSARGLPCPNIFTGGMNYHGPYECLPVKSLEASCKTVGEIIRLTPTLKSVHA